MSINKEILCECVCMTQCMIGDDDVRN